MEHLQYSFFVISHQQLVAIFSAKLCYSTQIRMKCTVLFFYKVTCPSFDKDMKIIFVFLFAWIFSFYSTLYYSLRLFNWRSAYV